MTRRHSADGELDILLPASAEGASLYLTSDGASAESGEGSLRWTARLAAGTGCPSGTLELPHATLPFGEDTFERIILSVRQGWPGDARARRLAAEIRRVLGPRGELLVLVPARLGYRRIADLVRPTRDEGGVAGRGRQRWRALMQLLSGWKAAPGRRALEHFLAAAGLAASEWFHPRRDARGSVVEVEPLRRRNPPWLQYRVLPARNRLRRSSWLVEEYAVRAGPGPPGESVLEQCISSISARIGQPPDPGAAPRIDRCLVTAKEKVVLLLRLGEQRMVMRIPLSEGALAGCRRNLAALHAIAEDPERRGLAPLPLDEASVRSGHYYTVESWLDGTPIASGTDEEKTLGPVEGLLRRLNPSSRLSRVRLDGDVYRRLVEQPVDRVLAVLPDPGKREWLSRWFREALEGRAVTLGIRHGDFSLNNIHLREGKGCGVIDWDDSALEGLPIEDAISHLSSRLVRRSDGVVSALLGLATRDALTEDEDAFLLRSCAYFGIDPALHPALTLLFWVRVVDAQGDFAFARSASYRQSRIEPVADAVIGDGRLRSPVTRGSPCGSRRGR